MLLKMSNGDIDWNFRNFVLDDFTLLKENESVGNYDVYLHSGDRASDVALWMNMSYDADPFYQSLMNNTKFKRALSIAIDRDEINELYYRGLGTPRAITAIRSEPTFEADVAEMNIEYDPAEANRILDELGFTKKNSDGIRLGPDGKPIFFTVFAAGGTWPLHADVAQVCIEYWRKIGVDGLLKSIERSVYYTMSQNNEFTIQSFTSPGTSLANNWWVFPQIGTHNSPAWGRWYATSGKEGVEPPAGSKTRMAMDLYREARQATNFDAVVDATKQILRWANEEIWGIGIVGEIPAVGAAKKSLKNIPKDAPSGTHIGWPGNLYPEQWFYDN
jgi:peptide/nickel transport system substrate-binding protein